VFKPIWHFIKSRFQYAISLPEKKQEVSPVLQKAEASKRNIERGRFKPDFLVIPKIIYSELLEIAKSYNVTVSALIRSFVDAGIRAAEIEADTGKKLVLEKVGEPASKELVGVIPDEKRKLTFRARIYILVSRLFKLRVKIPLDELSLPWATLKVLMITKDKSFSELIRSFLKLGLVLHEISKDPNTTIYVVDGDNKEEFKLVFP
jgi:hypothetical protein